MHQARRQPEPRRCRLEGGQQLAGHRHALRQAIEALGRAVGVQQARRQSPEAGRGAGIASPWRLLGAFHRHRDPPFGWIATGKPLPSAETAISAC